MLQRVRPKPEDYIDLVYDICKKYKTIKTNDTSYEDIVSVGKICLMKGIQEYDPKKGKFGPYINVKIRFGIIDYLRVHLPDRDWETISS